jgi:hypothetical protein
LSFFLLLFRRRLLIHRAGQTARRGGPTTGLALRLCLFFLRRLL